MRWRHHVGQRHGEVAGQVFRGLDQRRDEDGEGPQTARVQLSRERLDANADERRQRAGLHGGGDFKRRRLGVPVLFGIRPDAVTVFEVQPIVLDRFAFELVDHASADGLRKSRKSRRKPHDLGQRLRRWCKCIEGGERVAAGSLGRIARKGVGGADEGVNRLPARGISRIQPREFLIGCA
jgi:hypothetical protein